MRATGMYLRNTCYMSATMECNMTDSTTSSHALKYPNLACLWRHFDIEKMLKQNASWISCVFEHIWAGKCTKFNQNLLLCIVLVVLDRLNPIQYVSYWMGNTGTTGIPCTGVQPYSSWPKISCEPPTNTSLGMLLSYLNAKCWNHICLLCCYRKRSSSNMTNLKNGHVSCRPKMSKSE